MVTELFRRKSGFCANLRHLIRGWHEQASFHSSSSKAVLLAEASCYLPALLKFNTPELAN